MADMYDVCSQAVFMLLRGEKKVDLQTGYRDRRMTRIFLLGVLSGFPWVLIGSALSLWLKEEGLSRSTIGWAGLIFSVYAINFLWAPLIDRLRLPLLTARFGHRKSWILLFQFIIMLAVLGWASLNPVDNLGLVIGFGLVIALASASQDITIDALRIEQVEAHEKAAMAAGAAIAVVGWWSGFKLGGMVVLLVADWFQSGGHAAYWPLSFLVVIIMMLLMNIGLLLIPEASSDSRQANQLQAARQLGRLIGGESRFAQLAGFLASTLVTPLTSFFRQNGVAIGLGILGFIFLFKIGEAFMGKMSIVFYKEMGFSKADIGLYSKGLGWITTVVFTLIGGWFAIRAGTIRALLVAGVAMAATNLLFSLLAWSGKSFALFAIAIILDDLAAAFATVAFVAFISLLVDRSYTATQYALLASIGTMGRTTLASSSGALVDGLGGDWGLFFIITALMVVPSLVLLWVLRKRLAGGSAQTTA